MPLPVIDYTRIPAQGNPASAHQLQAIMQGIKMGFDPFFSKQELKKNKLANELSAITNQYAPQMNEEELKKMQLANALASITNQYAPQMNEEELKKMQLANALASITNQYAPQMNEEELKKMQLTNALAGIKNEYEPQMMNADLENKKAHTNYLETQNKYLPFDFLLKAQGANNKQTRFGAAYQFSKMLTQMPPAARNKYIAEHAAEYNEMLDILGNKTFQEEENKQNNILENAIKENFSQFMPKENLPLPVSEENKKLLIENAPTDMTLNLPQENKKHFVSDPELAESMKSIYLDEANKRLTTAATQRQAEGAQQLELAMNDPAFIQRANDAFQYAGALGKGKAFLDQLNQSNPQAYVNYRTFVEMEMKLMESRLKSLDQIGGTDKQREMLEKMFDVVKKDFASNPQRAAQYFEGLREAISNMSRAVIQSAQPVGETNRYSGKNKTDENKKPYLEGYRNKDIELTAQQKGWSIPETIRRLQEKKLRQ